VNTEDLIDALKVGHIGAVGLDVYEKGKSSLATTLLKKWGSLYTILRSFPCVNYRTPRLFERSIRGNCAPPLRILMHGHTMASLKTNLNNSFQIIIQTPHVI
jgi:hypothetical protein